MPKGITEKIRKDALRIKKLWASGYDDVEVRQRLKLQRWDAWARRIAYLQGQTEDRFLVWVRYAAKCRKRYVELAELQKQATAEKNLNCQLGIVRTEIDLDNQVAEMGVRLLIQADAEERIKKLEEFLTVKNKKSTEEKEQ